MNDRGMLVKVALMAAFVALSPQSSLAKERKFGDDLQAMVNGIAGCSRVKAKLKQYAKKYPDYHFAFAGRTGTSLTGMRGCGWGWNKKKSSAEATAMKYCRREEKKYGTDGGKKVCRLLKL